MWDVITYLFPSVNDKTVDVSELMNNFIPQFTVHVIIYPCKDC